MSKVSIPAGVGMDGRQGSNSPWRFLSNVYPKNGRLYRIGTSIQDERHPSTVDWYENGIKTDTFIPLAVVGSVPFALNGERVTCVVTIFVSNSTGTDYRVGYSFLKSDDYLPGQFAASNVHKYVLADISPYDPEPQKFDWTVKSLHNRVWLSGGNAVYVLAIDNPVPFGAGTLVARQGTVGAEVFRFEPIDDTAEWPSLDSVFGCKILEAHQNTMFYAGFRGERLYYSKDLTENQQALVGVELEADSLKALPNMLAWGRGNNPFAISIQRFVYVGTGGPIRALSGFKDTMLIFTDDEVWALRGALTNSPQLRRLVAGIGADGRHAVCSTEFGVVFTFRGRVYIADEEQVVNIGKPIEHTQPNTWDGLVPLMPFDSSTRIVYSSEHKRVFISVSTSGNTDPNVLVFDFDDAAWFAMALPVSVVFGNEASEYDGLGDQNPLCPVVIPDAGRLLFFANIGTVSSLFRIESGSTENMAYGLSYLVYMKSLIMSNEANSRHSDVRVDKVNLVLDDWSVSSAIDSTNVTVVRPSGTTGAMSMNTRLYTFPSGIATGYSVPTGTDPIDCAATCKYGTTQTWANLDFNGTVRGSILVPITYEEESFRFEVHAGDWYLVLVLAGSGNPEDTASAPRSNMTLASIEVEVNDRGPI